MKNIVLDINEITDSRQVYESKPNPFFRIFIYVVLGLLVSFIVWSCLFKIENTVKVGGVLEKNNDVISIVNKNDLIIDKVNIKDNDYVLKGDLLYSLKNDEIKKTYEDYKNLTRDESDRLKVLNAYLGALKGNEKEFNEVKDNKFYEEYKTRLDYLNGKKSAILNSKQNENNANLNGINTYQTQINENNNTLWKLETLKSSITSRQNGFSYSDTYYYNTANAYIISYNQTAADYDAKIQELINTGASEIDINIVKTKKNNALSSLERENLLNVSKEIESIKANNTSLQNSINELKVNLSSDNSSITIANSKLEEENVIYSMIETSKQKQKELEANFRTAKEQYDNTIVFASKSGYVDLKIKLVEGNLLQAGTQVLDITSRSTLKYKANVYIDNSKIGKITNGMYAKCELSSYPESDYGYLKGKISYISNNIKANNNDEYYYIAEIEIDDNSLISKDGTKVNLKDGMNLEARVITGKESVMKYLLKKIHLFD